MVKLSLCGHTLKLCNKKVFNISRILFSFCILYFGFTLMMGGPNVEGDVKMFKKACGKVFGSESKACSDKVFKLVEKVLSVNFITSAVLCLPADKKIQRYGSVSGIVGFILYALIVNNPFLTIIESSKAESLTSLINWDLFENFLLQMSICGVFLLIMANAYSKERNTEDLIRYSDDDNND